MPKNMLSKKVYEFIKARGCATIKEIAQALNVKPNRVYSVLRALLAKRLVLPYRPSVGRIRIYCIPQVGDKLYGAKARLDNAGMICITLPVSIIEIADEIAAKTGNTRSGVIRQTLERLIEEYFRRDNWQKQPEDEQQDGRLDVIVPDR